MKHNPLPTLVPFTVLLLLWKGASEQGIWSRYILPAPETVAQTAWRMLQSGQLLHHALISLERVFIGFGTAFILAAALTALSQLFPRLRQMDRWLLSVLQHIPPLSLIPLLILWFGIGETPKVIIIVLATFFPIYLNMEKSIERCDPRLLEVGKMVGMGPMELLLKIRLPSALPYILTGMQVGMGYSLRAIIGAEMIAADKGLGYLILDAQTMSRSDKVIIGIACIGTLGLLIDGFFSLLSRRLLPYERGTKE